MDNVRQSNTSIFYIHKKKGENWKMEQTITVRISQEDKELLEKLSRDTGLTISQLIRKGIKEVSKTINEESQSSIEISKY